MFFYSYVIESVIRVESNLVTSLDSVDVWGSSTSAVVACEVRISHILDLNKDLIIKSVYEQSWADKRTGVRS